MNGKQGGGVVWREVWSRVPGLRPEKLQDSLLPSWTGAQESASCSPCEAKPNLTFKQGKGYSCGLPYLQLIHALIYSFLKQIFTECLRLPGTVSGMKVRSDKFPAYVLEEEAEMWTGDLDTEWDRSTAQTKHTELGTGIAANPVWGGQRRISEEVHLSWNPNI